jgi:outer membrane receptor protein involved in Fe transport
MKFEDFAWRFFEGATQNSFTDIVNPGEHLSLTAGARTSLANDWTLDVAGGLSTAENSHRSSIFVDLGFASFSSDGRQDTKSTLPSLSAVVDGPLPTIGGITPRAAAGVEWRREELEVVSNGVGQSGLDRTLRSAFAELSLPLVTDGRPGLGNLELSLAGRYDDYSDFGGTFNPQVGVVWTPVEDLTLRGAFSKAFRAPALVELQSSVDAFLEPVPDPTRGGAEVPVLFVQGENPDLRAEKAETWSIGMDYKPAFARWAEISLSYFHIDYEGRIEQPSINADRERVLDRAERFPGLIGRNPTPADAARFLEGDADSFIENDTGVPFDPATQDILEVFPDLVLFDNRTSNIAVESVRGLDLRIDGTFETETAAIEVGINLTHSLDHDRQITALSPAFSLMNEVGKPADTRLRAKGGWTRGPYGAFAYLNYVADYANPFSTPRSGIGSWTTLDLSLRFDGSQFADTGPINGLDATLSVRNLFDNEPPRFADSLLGVLYDTTNASPFGRYVSLRLTKGW